MWKITKYYNFEACHIVHTQERYPRKCKSIHGHSYQLGVSLVGDRLDSSEFIMDYGYLDDIIKPEIEKIDHSYIYGDESDKDITNIFLEKKFRLYYIGYSPTAENISKYFAEYIYNNEKIRSMNNLKEIICDVKETDKTSCIYVLKIKKN